MTGEELYGIYCDKLRACFCVSIDSDVTRNVLDTVGIVISRLLSAITGSFPAVNASVLVSHIYVSLYACRARHHRLSSTSHCLVATLASKTIEDISLSHLQFFLSRPH